VPLERAHIWGLQEHMLRDKESVAKAAMATRRSGLACYYAPALGGGHHQPQRAGGVAAHWLPEVGMRSQPVVLVPGRLLYLITAVHQGLGLYISTATPIRGTKLTHPKKAVRRIAI
jgi:hypothetical protein